ncbi:MULTISPECIES: DUF7285 family protein [Salinibaculum]|uniref:DUF7285 family protein n=1 Tax=Salinibaculum TaxID=2732368 RepID=UPI0030CA8A37
MRRSSGRGQVEPLAALAAVLAVSAGLVIYADTLEEAVTPAPERETPEVILDGVERTLEEAGVVDPARLESAMAALPSGWHGNLTLRAGGKQWSRGPTPPSDADRATARVSVRIAPAKVRPGQLRVVVWR